MRLVSAESVTEAHPDKLADRVSDSVLDAIISQDPNARVAVETLLTRDLAVVAGEVATFATVDVQAIVRRAAREVGYNGPSHGFDTDHARVIVALDEQSPDIARGVSRAQEASSGDGRDLIGAGDQGLMFGYATDETPELMPLPIQLAHRIAQRLATVRKDGSLPYLRPDGKAQVTIRYDGDKPVALTGVVLSAQHEPDIELKDVREDLWRYVIQPELPDELQCDEARILVNPTGRFVEGGPTADAGLTGRKIIVDTYGGAAPHGGGAFSGKDPTKVDRSASYYARYIAKHIVAAGLARRCEVQLAYAIGVARPVGMYIDTFGTARVSDKHLAEAVGFVFDARPAAIIEELDLRRPIYTPTSAYGHFGRDELPWESTSRLPELAAYV